MSVDPADHMKLVYEVGSRIHGKFDRDDLHQVGFLSLIKACESFVPELGYKFSTYAVKVIERDMWKFAKKEQQFVDRKVSCTDASVSESNYSPELNDEDNEILSAVVHNRKKALMKRLGINRDEFKRRAKKVLDKL